MDRPRRLGDDIDRWDDRFGRRGDRFWRDHDGLGLRFGCRHDRFWRDHDGLRLGLGRPRRSASTTSDRLGLGLPRRWPRHGLRLRLGRRDDSALDGLGRHGTTRALRQRPVLARPRRSRAPARAPRRWPRRLGLRLGRRERWPRRSRAPAREPQRPVGLDDLGLRLGRHDDGLDGLGLRRRRHGAAQPERRDAPGIRSRSLERRSRARWLRAHSSIAERSLVRGRPGRAAATGRPARGQALGMAMPAPLARGPERSSGTARRTRSSISDTCTAGSSCRS